MSTNQIPNPYRICAQTWSSIKQLREQVRLANEKHFDGKEILDFEAGYFEAELDYGDNRYGESISCPVCVFEVRWKLPDETPSK